MKKKFLGSAAALGLAGLTVIPSICIVSSAQTHSEAIAKIKQNHKYASDVAYMDADNIWYPNLDALRDATGSSVSAARHDTPDGNPNSYNTSNKYFDSTTGYYISKNNTGSYEVSGYRTEDTSSMYYIPTSARYASNTSYKGSNNVWYPNLEALYKVTGSYSYVASKRPEQGFSETYHYFDPRYGYYTSSRPVEAVVDVSSGNVTTYYAYYSTYTGQYYSTYNEALKASGNVASRVINVSDYLSGYYYNGHYYDPYYYYLLMQRNGTDDTSDTSDTTASQTDNNAASGWSSVVSNIKSAESGKTISVNMKDETTIPSTVTSALKGKNVTLQVKLSSGTIYSINGKDISTAKTIDITSTYNTDNIPSKLVKAAYKKKNAVSTAQLTVNSNSFGADVSLTVKFSTKRAGCKAYLYRYNASSNKLSLVDTSSVKSSGQCTFDGITKGGDFVIVLS